MKTKIIALLLGFLILLSCSDSSRNGKTGQHEFSVPVEYYTLDNGLRVVLSQDSTAPTVVVALYYNIGFRIEPKNRTGFAHLMEHMMFQGSRNLGKMEFVKLVQQNGGILNGSTRYDFTNFYEIVPSHKLETVLWAEADRMKGLDISQENLVNQQGVVKNEVKVNVLNQPYGGFPWLDMPQVANENWYNAHNFYGELADLDAATLEDVRHFFATYYGPNNAALSVVGDFEPEEAKAWIETYFGNIPPSELPEFPDISEPRQESERKVTKNDSLATKPATAVAYKMPPRNTPEYYAMALLDQILVQGDNSLLNQKLVKEKNFTSNVNGGINYLLGNMYNYNGPMLWMFSCTYDTGTTEDSLLTAVDQVMEEVGKGISRETMDNALVKIRSSLYDDLSADFGVGRADLLCCFALFDNDPEKINRIESEFRKITPDLMDKTVAEYLRSSNRTILTLNPLGSNGMLP